MTKKLPNETRQAVESLVETMTEIGGDEAAKRVLVQVHERYAERDPVAYLAWARLTALLDAAAHDAQVAACPEAGALAELLTVTVRQGFFQAVRALGTIKPEDEVLELLYTVIQEQRTQFMVRNRQDQRDKRVFQNWLRQSNVRVERIPDLLNLPSGDVPNEVRVILVDTSADALRDWYLEIHPGSLKAGRPPSKKPTKTRRKAST